mgnify:CR=1 FL=1
MTDQDKAVSPLLDHLKRRIAIAGPITVADYMADALAHPQWGYYRKQDPFGSAGDFVTAPEISQMFGELIGLWAAVTWQQMGSPSLTLKWPWNMVFLPFGMTVLIKFPIRKTRRLL